MATRQRGVISREQLLEAGLGADAINYRAQIGELHPLFRGIYLIGDHALAPLAREAGALLACGVGAVLSHATAGAVWAPSTVGVSEEVEVTIVDRKLRSRPGIKVHRTDQLDRRDVRPFKGLRITSPARTLIDLAAVGFERLEAACSEMQSRDLVKERDLARALKTAPKRRGMERIRTLAAASERGFTRSEAERRLRELCQRARLPQPRSNARVCGLEVDFLWPRERLVIEVDGYRYHGHRTAFERDRERDGRLVAAGYRVIRVTWRMLLDEPFAVVAMIARALDAYPTGGRAPG